MVSTVQITVSYLSFLLHVVAVLLMAVVMNAIWCVPPLRRKVYRHVASQIGVQSDLTDWEADEMWESSGNFQCVKTLISSKWRQTQQGVLSKGSTAYNASLHRLDGSQCHLMDFARPGRPLVISFGSCS